LKKESNLNQVKKTYLTLLLLPLFALVAFCSYEPAPPFRVPEVIKSEKLDFRLDTIAEGLNSVWSLTFLPNGDILFTEKNGTLHAIQNGKINPMPIGGVPKVRSKGQGGLFDIELHPNYRENGWIYLTYAGFTRQGEEGNGANTTLMRARLKDHQLVDQEILFKALPNYTKGQHFGGRIEFDKEGYLYVSVGDRGGRDENQTTANYRGKVFRLFDDGSIPDDNPFVDEEGANPEIFTNG
jgi:glucose/arabinose dehydrogenase